MGKMFSDEMKRLRAETGLGQKAFALHVGIAEGTIANVESGNRLLGTDNLDKVVASLKLGKAGRERLMAARDADRASSGTRSPGDPLEERLRLLEERVEALEAERRLAPVLQLPAHEDPDLAAAAKGDQSKRGQGPTPGRTSRPKPSR